MTERISPQNREEWLDCREQQGIGGSEAASVADVSPWKSRIQLWREKTGRAKPKDLSGVAYVQEGKRMEPAVREFFKALHQEYDVEYHEFDILFQTETPFIFATLDGEITDVNSGERGILEIKNVAPTGKAAWEQWNGKIPDHYYYQILHQLIATNYPFAILVAALRGLDGSITIREYEFRAADCAEDMSYYKTMAEIFWGWVEKDQMPPMPIG